MTPPKSEKTVLRTELRRVWGVVEILLGVLAGSVRMTGNVLKAIIDEMAQLSEENIVLRGTIKKMEQRIRIHESWNHSPAEATEYARNRRQFQEGCKRTQGKGGAGTTRSDATKGRAPAGNARCIPPRPSS